MYALLWGSVWNFMPDASIRSYRSKQKSDVSVTGTLLYVETIGAGSKGLNNVIFTTQC